MAPRGFRERTLGAVLLRAAKQFPAVFVTGPRQSGKTTLVKRLFGKTHGYCSLDDPVVRQQAQADPRLLLERFGRPLVLDEIQYAPELLHYVKLDVDEHRSMKGRYILTGSQVLPLMHRVTESLAGRAAVLSLLSMSLAEIRARADPHASWYSRLFPHRARREARSVTPSALARLLLRGGFPEPALHPTLDLQLWLASYVQTYLERDVRTLRAVGELGDFEKFLFSLAARTSGLLNYTDLAREVGVAEKTVKGWISLLEASGQVVTVRPYHANVGKRLMKRPKVYFLDTGILGYLLGVSDATQVLRGVGAGPMFEAAVFGQLVRLFVHRGRPPRMYFWRTAAGHEVDFVIDEGRRLIPIEAKLTSTPRPAHAEGIEQLQNLLGRRAGPGLLVCTCAERFPLTRSVEAVPLASL